MGDVRVDGAKAARASGPPVSEGTRFAADQILTADQFRARVGQGGTVLLEADQTISIENGGTITLGGLNKTTDFEVRQDANLNTVTITASGSRLTHQGDSDVVTLRMHRPPPAPPVELKFKLQIVAP